MSRFLMVLVLVGVSVACAAASEPHQAAAEAVAPPAPVIALAPEPAYTPVAVSAADVSCDIDVSRIRGGVRLEALAALNDAPRSPLEYSFVITKHGAGGSSDIRQGGELNADPEQTLGAVDLNLERGARYRAELTLRDDDGEVCSTEVRS